MCSSAKKGRSSPYPLGNVYKHQHFPLVSSKLNVSDDPRERSDKDLHWEILLINQLENTDILFQRSNQLNFCISTYYYCNHGFLITYINFHASCSDTYVFSKN